MTVRNAAQRLETKVVESLIDVLSDTYVLMVKTHGYHWNVLGKYFASLHALFGDQYKALFEAADDLAERLRALDVPAPGSFEAFLENTAVEEETGVPLTAEAMIKDLMKSHETVRQRLIKAADDADEADDIGTEDLLVGRLRAHEKMIWMLKSHVV